MRRKFCLPCNRPPSLCVYISESGSCRTGNALSPAVLNQVRRPVTKEPVSLTNRIRGGTEEVGELTDEELIGLYFARSEQVIEAVEEKYGAYCRTIARRILGSEEDAEECVSDVWLRAWNAIPPQRPDHLKGWLGTVARNRAVSLCRARNREPERVEEAAEELAASLSGGPEDHLEAAELGRAISAFLAGQAPAVRGVFLRRYWYGDTVEEAARWAGWSVSRTKSALFRLRKKLKTYLEKEELYHE